MTCHHNQCNFRVFSAQEIKNVVGLENLFKMFLTFGVTWGIWNTWATKSTKTEITWTYLFIQRYFFLCREREKLFKHNSSFMSRLSTRRKHGSSSSGGPASPMVSRHGLARRTQSASVSLDEHNMSHDTSMDTINRLGRFLFKKLFLVFRRKDLSEAKHDVGVRKVCSKNYDWEGGKLYSPISG